MEKENIGYKKSPSQNEKGLVPEAGIEPALRRNTSLSRARLPVPPLRHLDELERKTI
jgi:hypothetical protein